MGNVKDALIVLLWIVVCIIALPLGLALIVILITVVMLATFSPLILIVWLILRAMQ